MNLFPTHTADKTGLGLIYDVGSASVACSLVKYSHKDTPQVLYTTRQRARVESAPSHHALLVSVGEAVDRATHDVLTEGKKYVHRRTRVFKKSAITNVEAVFSAPWIASTTKVVTIEKSTPILVSRRFVQNVLQKEKERIRASLSENPVFLGDKGRSAEEDIIGFRLNGYPTTSPYGKSAQTIEIVLYVSFVQQSIVQKIMEKANQHFNVGEVGLHTFPLVGRTYIETIYPEADEYTLIEITGEYASVSLVKNKTVYGTELISAGFHSLIRNVKDAFESSFEVAYSHLKMSFEGRIDADVQTKIEKAYTDSLIEWGTEFKKALVRLQGKGVLSKKVFIVADQYGEEIFKQKIAEVMKAINADQEYDVVSVDIEQSKGCCDFKQDARGDVFVAIESCYFNTRSTPDLV